jgi:hypothetical protein
MARPLNNAELLTAIAAMSGGEDDAKLRALYRALQDAMVVVVASKTRMKLTENQTFIRTYEDKSGREILIAYTSFDLAPVDLERAVMPFAELCKQVAAMGLAIHLDPGSPHGGIAPPNWVRAIAEGAADMPGPTPVVPARLVDLSVSPARDIRAPIRLRLSEGLIASRDVVDAYLAYATPDETKPPILTLCVVVPTMKVATTRGHNIAVELHAWVRPLMRDDEEIDFLVLRPEDALVAKFKAAGPAFYRRS